MGIKFNCSNPKCGRRISVDEALSGKTVSCPACGHSLSVPGSTSIKFSCSHKGCGQHIVVDVSEAGRFVRCPSCGGVLQIPGGKVPPSMPKSLPEKSVPRSDTFFADLTDGEVWRGRLYKARLILARLVCGWGMGGMILASCYLRHSFLQHHLNSTADAILSHRILGIPVGSRHHNVLFYAQSDPGGAHLYRLNLTTLQRKEIKSISAQLGTRDFNWIGFSPNQKRVACYINAGNNHSTILIIRDVDSNATLDAYALSTQEIEAGQWLTDNTIALLGSSDSHFLLNLQKETNLGKYGNEGFVGLQSIRGRKIHSFSSVSGHSVVYAEGGQISRFDLAADKIDEVTDITGRRVQGLRYSPGNESCIFYVAESKTNFHVYEYGPMGFGKAQMVSPAQDNATNADWIQDGTGIAYIGTKGVWHMAPKKGQAYAGTNFLAVRTQNPLGCTNLFERGMIQGYSVDPAGKQLYVVAANRLGLSSIWEYDIPRKTLRDVLPGNKRFQFVAPVEKAVTNDNGEEVYYYYMPPVGLDPHKKYPVVLDNYLANSYELSGQFLANSGIFYVSADHFGITDWRDAPLYEQTMAVYEDLLKNPNVDRTRIYISGTSKSTVVACQLAEMHPELWRGLILLSPVRLPEIPANVKHYPSLFVSTGNREQTELRENNEDFVMRSLHQGIPAELDYQPAPHAYPSQQFMNSYKKIAQYILSDF